MSPVSTEMLADLYVKTTNTDASNNAQQLVWNGTLAH
jgi:hypothetical protein